MSRSKRLNRVAKANWAFSLPLGLLSGNPDLIGYRCDTLGIICGWPSRKESDEVDQSFPSQVCREEAGDAERAVSCRAGASDPLAIRLGGDRAPYPKGARGRQPAGVERMLLV